MASTMKHGYSGLGRAAHVCLSGRRSPAHPVGHGWGAMHHGHASSFPSPCCLVTAWCSPGGYPSPVLNSIHAQKPADISPAKWQPTC